MQPLSVVIPSPPTFLSPPSNQKQNRSPIGKVRLCSSLAFFALVISSSPIYKSAHPRRCYFQLVGRNGRGFHPLAMHNTMHCPHSPQVLCRTCRSNNTPLPSRCGQMWLGFTASVPRLLSLAEADQAPHSGSLYFHGELPGRSFRVPDKSVQVKVITIPLRRCHAAASALTVLVAHRDTLIRKSAQHHCWC